MSARELDCRDLQCPMPIVKLSLAVRAMTAGELLMVSATDPAFQADLEAWSQMTGHSIVSFETGPVLRAVVRV